MKPYWFGPSKDGRRVLGRGLRPILTTLSLSLLTCLAPAYSNAANNPVPFIDQPVFPIAVRPGASGAKLQVTGGGFVSGSVVDWNGSPLSTAFLTDRTLSAAVPAADLASPGTASVTVVNPAPDGGSSNVIFVQVIRKDSTVVMPQSDNALDVVDSVVVTGDFNHDGKLDVAALSGGADAVTVLLGNGNGTFQTPVDYPLNTGFDGSGIVVGDFNNDGNLDFAVTSENGLNPGVVSIMLGNGDGTFQAPLAPIAVNGSPDCIATADVNGDGNLDLVVGYDYADNGFLSVLLGNGNGTFGPPVDYAASRETNSLQLADFNNDGNIDIATLDMRGADSSLLLGNGNGTFGPPSVYFDQFAENLAAADFNGDGNQDIAVGGAILLGNGNGTFQQGGVYNGPTTTQSLAVGDFNGDGKLDLAGPSTTSSIAIDFGNGDGTFQSPLEIPLVANDQIPIPVWVTPGDFNQDGHLDLAVVDSDEFPGTVTALLQSTLQLTPSTWAFPPTVIGSSSRSENIKVLNFGASPVSVGSISITGFDPGDFSQTTTCGSTLEPQKTCVVTVTFKPTAAGDRVATLSLFNATLGLAQSVSLYGTGNPVSLSPTSLNFGNQPVAQTSSAQTVTVTNLGTTAVTIYAISVHGADVADFAQTNNCGATLGAGASCTINVTFTPTATGSRSASVVLYDNGGGSPQAAPLSGTGT
jgi:hypothetical protein